MARKPPTLNAADRAALDDIRIFDGKRRRPLTKAEAETLSQLYAIKGDFGIGIEDHAPPGTILARAARHIVPTDISLIMPIVQIVMLAASQLTQIGAYLDVPGVDRIRPTHWTNVLAASARVPPQPHLVLRLVAIVVYGDPLDLGHQPGHPEVRFLHAAETACDF